MYHEDTAIQFIEQAQGCANDTIFNKLAQLPTILQGADIQKLNRRARSKWYTEQISKPLAQLNSPLSEYYARAHNFCNQEIKRNGKKLTSRYCNSRHCNTCNRIRTAKAINHYGKQFKEIEGLEFTTLTIPNCSGTELKSTIEKMTKNISNITRVLREKRGIDYTGIRKIEVTYNSTMDTYHPHFHILHSGNCGTIIIDEWMKRYPKSSIKAQDTKLANQGSVNELFKYATKVLVKDNNEKNTLDVFLPAIDTIMIALHKKRSFQTFGKIKMISEDIEELNSEEYESLIDNYDTYYCWNESNWYDFYNDEPLTNYKPPDIKFKIYD
jgi:hypothetical protein